MNSIISLEPINLKRVKGDENACFRIESNVRRLYHVPLALECCDERSENGDGEEGNKVSRRGERVKVAWTLVC